MARCAEGTGQAERVWGGNNALCLLTAKQPELEESQRTQFALTAPVGGGGGGKEISYFDPLNDSLL